MTNKLLFPVCDTCGNRHYRRRGYPCEFQSVSVESHSNIEALTFEAVKRIRNYSGLEYKGKELGQQLGIRWLRC